MVNRLNFTFGCTILYILLAAIWVLFGGFVRIGVSVGVLGRQVTTKEAFRIMKPRGFGSYARNRIQGNA